MRILFYVLLFYSSYISAQRNPYFSLQPKIYRENPKAFRFKRPADFNAKLNWGAGAELLMIFNKRNASGNLWFGYGPSVGQYFFWNPRIKNYEYPYNYTENNLVSPLYFNFLISKTNWVDWMQNGKGVWFHVSTKAGLAYVQNMITNVDTDRSINNSRFTYTYGINTKLFFRVGKGRMFFGLGFEYFNIGGKHFGGTFY